MSDKFDITINGQPIAVEPGTMVLDAARRRGVPVPTLCDHPSLDPSGACRMCVVEISHADWNGWTGLVTSCLYPVEPGLQVSTLSKRVHETRRTLLELYLARCPESEEIKAIARAEGVDETPFPPKVDADKCIQCGLCVRVCDELSVQALAPLGRGTDKTVGPRPDDVGEDCVGCLACADICPTGEIEYTRTGGKLGIWNRSFYVPLCAVQTALCRGCGACEQACPFDVPRVYATRDGNFLADISRETCTGCGICAGACPTGAIIQRGWADEDLCGWADQRGKVTTYACDRSHFTARDDVISISCVGRVSVDDMLTCLARGADGVQLVCRDRDSCPYGEGGHLGEEQAAVANDLAAIAGLGDDRIRYVKPRPGPGGPDETVAAFRADRDTTPLTEPCPVDFTTERGLDRALTVIDWLAMRPELTPRIPDDITALFDTDDTADDALWLGGLVELDRLLAGRVADWRLRDVLADAGAMLRGQGLKVRLALTDQQVGDAKRVIALDPGFKPGSDVPVVTLDELAGAETAAAPTFHFRITHEERRALVDRLKAAGAAPIRTTPTDLAQLKLITRQGAWLAGRYAEPAATFAFTEEVER